MESSAELSKIVSESENESMWRERIDFLEFELSKETSLESIRNYKRLHPGADLYVVVTSTGIIVSNHNHENIVKAYDLHLDTRLEGYYKLDTGRFGTVNANDKFTELFHIQGIDAIEISKCKQVLGDKIQAGLQAAGL